MKSHNPIHDAIDESLSGVHFDLTDMHRVLRASRLREEEPVRPPRRRMRVDLVFACAMLLILVVPLSLFAVRTRTTQTTHVVAAPGISTAGPIQTPELREDVIATQTAQSGEESEAIRIARLCFEAQCDTSIFSFEEYAVSVACSEEASGARQYTVDMTSIYGNGCRFTVVVSMPSGEVLQYSTPELATMPTYLDTSAPEIQAWYEKNGPYLFTWSAEDQVEFSRRYEGGSLRLPTEGELTFDEASTLARTFALEQTGYSGSLSYAYPVLYAESSGSSACYVVYCCDTPVTDTLPEQSITVSFSPTGENPSIQSNTLLPSF